MESASLGLTSCIVTASALSTAAGLLQNAYVSMAASSTALAMARLGKGEMIGMVGGVAVLVALGVVGALCWTMRRTNRMELPRMDKTSRASSMESILPLAAGGVRVWRRGRRKRRGRRRG